MEKLNCNAMDIQGYSTHRLSLSPPTRPSFAVRMMAATMAPFKTDKSSAVFEEAKVRRSAGWNSARKGEREKGRDVVGERERGGRNVGLTPYISADGYSLPCVPAYPSVSDKTST